MFRIGRFNFHLWQGQPPAVPFTQIDVKTRPGVDGIRAKRMGVWHSGQNVLVSAYMESFAQAVNFQVSPIGYMSLPQVGPLLVIYNDINYWARYRLKYLAINPTVRQIQAGDFCGPDFEYVNGARIDLALDLIPVR